MRLKWHGSLIVGPVNTRDSKPQLGKLAVELPANRFAIETSGGTHRIYDMAPADGEADVNKVLKAVADHGIQREKDRAAINDSDLSMPARLAALNRLLTQS